MEFLRKVQTRGPHPATPRREPRSPRSETRVELVSSGRRYWLSYQIDAGSPASVWFLCKAVHL